MKKKAIKDEVVIRSGGPWRKSTNEKGVVFKGFTIEAIDTVPGEEIDGNSTWYQDKNGDFYWSGGFEKTSLVTLNDQDEGTVKFDYNSLISQIPENVRDKKGKNIKIALIDSGTQISTDAFKGRIKGTFNAVDHSSNVRDAQGHGTHIGGLLCANNSTLVNGILGIAQEADLYVCKVTNTNKIESKNLIEALKWAIDGVKCDIINMSLKLSDVNKSNADSFTELINLLKKAQSKNIILVAAAGNNSILTKKYEIGELYPASYGECISVGAVNRENFKKLKNDISEKVSFILPQKPVYSLDIEINHYRERKGSSISTAVITGMLSLIKSYYPKNKPNSEIIDDLIEYAIPLQSDTTYKSNPLTVYYNETS